jgi:hypothetical protein
MQWDSEKYDIKWKYAHLEFKDGIHFNNYWVSIMYVGIGEPLGYCRK